MIKKKKYEDQPPAHSTASVLCEILSLHMADLTWAGIEQRLLLVWETKRDKDS